MRVLIFEPGEGGHRLQYIRSMLPAITPLADVIIALREDVRTMPDFSVILGNLAELGDRVTIDASVPAGHPLKFSTQWNRIGALRSLIDKTGAQRVYIPSADGLAQVMGISRMLGRHGVPRDVPCEALLLRGGFAYPSIGGWKQTVKVRSTWTLGSLAPFSVVHLLDPIVYQRVTSDDPGAVARYRLMPDPVETPQITDRIAARLALGLPEDSRMIGCAGFIDLRKGIDLLLRAMRDTPGLAKDRLLLAGKHFAGVYELLSGEFAPMVKSGQVISIDKLLTPDEVNTSVAAMDLVCTPYRNHVGSASILIRAAVVGRPVLAQNWGWMEYIVKRFKLGDTCDVFNPAAFSKALEDSLNRAPEFQLTEAGHCFGEFHAISNFAAHWCASLRGEMGMPPPPELRSWDWVLDAAH